MLWVCCPTHAKLPVNIGPYSHSQGLPKMGVVPYKTRAFFLKLYHLFYYTLVHFLWVITVPFSNARRLYFFAPVIFFNMLLQEFYEFLRSKSEFFQSNFYTICEKIFVVRSPQVSMEYKY